MSYQQVHEPITVTAKFAPRKRVEIYSFDWQEKEYVVEKVHLSVTAHKGTVPVWLFNVSTKTAAFKLRLDTDTMQWWLEEISWELSEAGLQ